MTFPDNWHTRRARFSFSRRDVRGADAPLASATKDGVTLRSDLDFSVWNPESNVSNYKLVEPDDFVIGLRSFQHGISHSTVRGIVSPAYTVLRSAGDLEPKFFKHYFRSSLLISRLANITQGIRQGQAIDIEAFQNLPMPVPPLEEQRRIADFLDAETVRIDALARAYVKLRELASERSQRVIDAEIEQHQDRIPFRYLTRFREGPGIMAVDFHDAGTPLIRISGLQRGEVTLNGCNFLDPEKVSRQWSQFRLKLGDRLISGSATMGEVSVVQDPAVIGSIPYTGLIILRPARPDVDMKYVEAFLRSSLFFRQIDVLKTGATMQHFGPTHLSQIQAPMPSPHEQLRIVEHVQGALAHAGRCGDLVDRQLALLAERRQALITAAVTGQFDVSTASGRNVTDGVTA
ncbi:restriction endonuclease subunit S [Streptomyces sp. MB09-02B]|uniref:restriction endonuclease subunit S n=1 Tax=Streptomyces sp. MB09-02B TaxID=3028667 RepID=UPI0029B848D5|nr:restriction endonuclease subunit S [Streptomyces sp. MB09-02B]MDX3640279.1 restriction endonuclease subunit S [Streptomyces sp. MB09-02B]